ncbi:helix-turn-helix domain-containing protein, partial [uncultured Nevskia sp.]|uniref:helix-turn-helix domain-containing protein n=1 Tax=uncultured Nevskia sp. TaxID=228950 RepID=UPI0025F1D64C
MGTKFSQFGLEARCEIARRRAAGESLRQIGAALDCSASSVSRELTRNAAKAGYQPVYADEQAHARRWHGSRLLRDAALQAEVLGGLSRGWSPEQVSAHLTGQISYESIYR